MALLGKNFLWAVIYFLKIYFLCVIYCISLVFSCHVGRGGRAYANKARGGKVGQMLSLAEKGGNWGFGICRHSKSEYLCVVTILPNIIWRRVMH